MHNRDECRQAASGRSARRPLDTILERLNDKHVPQHPSLSTQTEVRRSGAQASPLCRVLERLGAKPESIAGADR